MFFKVALILGSFAIVSSAHAMPSNMVGSWLSKCQNDDKVFDKNGNLVSAPQNGSSIERFVIAADGTISIEDFNYTGLNCTGRETHTPLKKGQYTNFIESADVVVFDVT